jgi:ribosomal protein L16 Arg81 hydroxylase
MFTGDFDTAIAPIDTATFFSEYWEQRPLSVTRNNPHYYSNLFSMRDVDAVISFTEPKFPQIQLFSNGKSVPWNSACERAGMQNINQIYDEYDRGNTVILRGLHHCWKPISELYRNWESLFHHRVHVNMYLTPKNAQGFAPHFDTHEVFILQIEGSKHWRIYDTFQAIPLPINQQPIPPEKLQEPLQEITLNAGDLLYLPSGYVHEALTSECSSLHLTVGINVYRWSDLLATALASASDQVVSLRKALPVGFLRQSEARDLLKTRFEELLAIFSDRANLEEAFKHLSQRVIEEMPPIPDGHFTQLDRLDEIDLDTIIKKRQGTICQVVREPNSVTIQFPGNAVKGPTHIEPALQFIVNSPVFPVGSLPDSLTDNAKLTLVRRLVKEGLLAIATS